MAKLMTGSKLKTRRSWRPGNVKRGEVEDEGFERELARLQAQLCELRNG
jgi:hypothetical protein